MAQSTTQLRYRDLLSKMVMLAIPTLLEQILSTLLQYVDTAMVGRLGEQATASVSVTTTIGWLVGSIAYALGTAVLALISRAYGANDTRRGNRLANQALLLILVCCSTVFVKQHAFIDVPAGLLTAEAAFQIGRVTRPERLWFAAERKLRK